MGNKVEDVQYRGRPKKTWTEAVEKDCQIQQLNEKDAMDQRLNMLI